MDYMKFRLRSFFKLGPIHSLFCGSQYELPLKYCSDSSTDVDYLSYCYDICAIPWNRNPPINTRCTILRIDSTETPSGYARLKVDGDSTQDKSSYYHRPRMLASIPSGGAAMQSVDTVTVTLGKGYKYETISSSTDNVFAIYCPYWPLEADEWRKRKRFHGWPNEKLIARITRGGCHFVSKLRTWSSSDDTEWRFSFSKAELILIHSFTNVQKTVYHIIRSIKKSVAKCCGGDRGKGLQTYYFKTLMFWACEEFSPEFWREGNINTCVETLLFRFLSCLKDKWCPSYFIPRCNIMCHLKGEGSFEGELQFLLKVLESGVLGFACDMIMRDATGVTPGLTFWESNCLNFMSSSLPINEDLNGRLSQYLVKCEWFLPGMKYLHAAVETILRLMSIDNVTSRKRHKDCIECLESFKCAPTINEDFNSFKYLNPELSFYENLNVILVRKLTRNSIPIYRRHRRSFEDEQMHNDPLPSLLFCVVSAYRANFYFTAMQSYKECLTEYKRCVDVFNKARSIFGNEIPRYRILCIPVLICNSLSQIYDEHLQVILGFATLHRNISSFESSNCSIGHEVCLKVNPMEFLKYLCIQCERKLSALHVLTDSFHSTNLDFYQPIMSKLRTNELDSAAILFAALRQSRVYAKPLEGDLIPRHFSYVP